MVTLDLHASGTGMLSATLVENFKSFDHARLHLAPVTVLVGANASGKINLIEALQILAWMGQGKRLSDLKTSLTHRKDLLEDFCFLSLGKDSIGFPFLAASDHQTSLTIGWK
ncbi:MAG: hypothetical protein EAZ99_15580 [Alphaproteobacteria bacterium]|nr:MAG: hypothetical protein EAZ99_15580 [Alphaproteobacteria bacterium]